jgi:hypothetical protein
MRSTQAFLICLTERGKINNFTIHKSHNNAMRNAIIILMLTAGCYVSAAQNKPDSSLTKQTSSERNIYIDLSPAPGVSATYTWKFGDHFDMGTGVNYRYFGDDSYGKSRAAVYLDVRPHWGKKKSLFFFFTDLGMCVNGGPQPTYETMSPVGVYLGLGPGYCYRINKKGMGPYISLGIDAYSATLREKYPIPPNSARTSSIIDGRGVLSIGFKF